MKVAPIPASDPQRLPSVESRLGLISCVRDGGTFSPATAARITIVAQTPATFKHP